MLLEIQETSQPRIFRLIGELDISNAETLAAVLDREVDEQGDISLELSELTFMDSSGIRVLLRAMDRLNGRGKIMLVSPTSSVRHVLSLMGLDDRDSIRVVGSGEQAGP
ncbi:MAG TPA: STAS domain-containing protein [Actinomycetota bacterium]|nr:STAS domain-containing protein [Actinomycetota bacterium]